MRSPRTCRRPLRDRGCVARPPARRTRLTKRTRIFIGILVAYALGVGVPDVSPARRHRSALSRVGRGLARRHRAADGLAGRERFARRNAARRRARASLPLALRAPLQRRHLRRRQDARRAAHDGRRPAGHGGVRFARRRRRRRSRRRAGVRCGVALADRRRPLALARRLPRPARALRRAHDRRRRRRPAHLRDVRRRADPRHLARRQRRDHRRGQRR